MVTYGEDLDTCIDELTGLIQSVRRHLHANPEPSREEYRTTLALAGHLEEAGIPYHLAPTGRGLIAGPKVEPGTPIVAMRADLDALRMQDGKIDAPYHSTRDGVMHGCGHDAHAAMVLGAALALHHVRDRFLYPLPWRAIFQPAEETGEGAAEMVQIGAMEGVRAIVALHVDPDRLVGRVGQRRGVLTACSREIFVVVRGRGGHSARPFQAIDPIAAAVQFVSSAYQLVPRRVDARDPVVVTFGSIYGGDAANVIPERVELRGVIRTFSRSARERVDATLSNIAQGVAVATGTEIDLTFLQGTDSVINDRAVNETLAQAAAEVVGADHVEEIAQPSLGGEDFSVYLTCAPGALLRLGVARELPWPLLHTPKFDIDERALAIGAKILARCVARLAWHAGGSDDGLPTSVRPE